MRLTFTFDDKALQRSRLLKLVQSNKPAYAVKQDQIYQPIRDFFAIYENRGYPFTLLELLQATAVKMLGFPASVRSKKLLRRSLFSTGGLYLALDINHTDLAIRQHFGDFTSSFSHQIGVGLSTMSMSEAFGIPLDKLSPIPVQGKRVLDYIAEIPNGSGWLQLEAKGVTSFDSRSNARRDICKKKNRVSQSLQKNNQGSVINQTAMIGVIIQAVHEGGMSLTSSRKKTPAILEQGIIEIIDPDSNTDLVPLHASSQKASLYWHYAGAAIFAGLYDIAAEFVDRANALISGRSRPLQLQNLHFNERNALEVSRRKLVGVQWRPSDIAEQTDDVWFYQAIDKNVIRDILVDEIFPSTEPYHYHEPLSSREGYVENILPDGSYFGIGIIPRDALRKVDQRGINLRDLQY